MTQQDQVIEYLTYHPSLTTLGASNLRPPVLAPAKIISNLKKLGVPIKSHYVTNPNTKRSYKVYRLED